MNEIIKKHLKEFDRLVENRTLVNVGVGEDGTLRKEYMGEWRNFLQKALEEVYEWGKEDATREHLKAIEDYQVPRGFGSASGAIGMGAVTDYLKDYLNKGVSNNKE